MTYIQWGVALGLLSLVIYFWYRRKIKRKTYAVDDIIKTFAGGFSISISIRVMLIGIQEECDSIEKIVHISMIIGGFAMLIFVIDATRKMIIKEDP